MMTVTESQIAGMRRDQEAVAQSLAVVPTTAIEALVWVALHSTQERRYLDAYQAAVALLAQEVAT